MERPRLLNVAVDVPVAALNGPECTASLVAVATGPLAHGLAELRAASTKEIHFPEERAPVYVTESEF